MAKWLNRKNSILLNAFAAMIICSTTLTSCQEEDDYESTAPDQLVEEERLSVCRDREDCSVAVGVGQDLAS